MIQIIGSEEWIRILAEAAGEVVRVALGFDDCTVRPHHDEVEANLAGAYLPLGIDEQSVQLALLSTTSGCQTMGKALLGMTAEDEDLSASDLADAVSEIVNVLAGGIKRRLHGRMELKLGLPLFVRGAVQPSDRIDISSAVLALGGIEAMVLIASPKRQSCAEHVHEAVQALRQRASGRPG